jgi:hypothetical protein
LISARAVWLPTIPNEPFKSAVLQAFLSDFS